ncbi:hypothetical protein O3M35_005894 [Rhynocoris fuscipes]|uniref:Uncharacterized protein n=1 Tax=Rhynocoris fuscipes TaxID=488301 RepID=A0AAW1DS09_9HEMI
MSVDLRRSRSLSQDLRPRVSFNRDVHVKRYGGKKPLGRIDEEESDLINNMRGRRGKADGTDYNMRRSSLDNENNTTMSNTTAMIGGRKHKENQTFGQRLRSLFGGGGGGSSGSNNKKKHHHTVSTSTNTLTSSSTNIDPLRSRYKEYRGEVSTVQFIYLLLHG